MVGGGEGLLGVEMEGMYLEFCLGTSVVREWWRGHLLWRCSRFCGGREFADQIAHL